MHVSGAGVGSWGGTGPMQSLLVYTAWVKAMLGPGDLMLPPFPISGSWCHVWDALKTEWRNHLAPSGAF